ncbi:hypothetical protein J4T96_gp094 [Mycobacterium phage Finemlucis]|uniref:Uncharacterized protein n=1 Tax=Mycobacterium phage Finemlucis TaxID=2015844 RepID=A0A291IA01_9CAUD|nr:hypothetical protein J4T96_gp094 [Mycobacterium phage Finemlucis]ATG86505.1 hypothetical protein SEA_FINEMLUCIS_94 [Mycobacterium phage Finemlucis]
MAYKVVKITGPNSAIVEHGPGEVFEYANLGGVVISYVRVDRPFKWGGKYLAEFATIEQLRTWWKYDRTTPKAA